MNVLLLFPPNTHAKHRASHLTSNIESVYPLGIGYIARVLELDKHNVSFIDCQFPHNTIDVINNTMREKNIDVVGISSSTPNSYQAYDLVRGVKKKFPNTPIIMGGPHIVAIKTDIFKECPEIDYIIYGEAEETIVELVRCLGSKGDISKIKGVAYKKDGEIKVNEMRPFIQDLDTIPYPAYHLTNLKNYRPVAGMFRALPFANMITSRGCPYRCIFCCKSNWGNVCRMRSVENILGEIDLLVKDYGIKEIAFFDDTFTVNRERVIKLCNEMIKRYPGLIWKCSSRVNHVDKELLQLMKKAGCYSIGYGIESGDDNILRIMRKGTTTDLCRRVVKWTKEVGIEIRAYYMINNLGDTRETVEKTIAFSRELDSEFIDFEIVHPLPGSELWEVLPTMPGIKINWERWNDWNNQAGHYVLFTQNDLDEDFIRNAYRRANTGYYLRPLKILKTLKIALSNRHMFIASVKAFGNILRVRAK